MPPQPSIRVGSVDIEWDLTRGDLRFFGLDSVLFWTNPSLYHLLAPLVEETGVELFRLLVAHSSSLGTDADYELMVTKLGTDFVSGFLAWGEAVSAAGWGRFEVLAYDPATCTAHVRVRHPWELQMQQGRPLAWGCPFLQGKIIGLFTHAFGRACWAEEVIVHDPGQPRLDLHVHPSDRVLDQELMVLRGALQAEREGELVSRIEHATAELRSKIAVIDHQRELIARLTYPILQVWQGVLAAVLVGELNDAAMSDLTYALLERVQTAPACPASPPSRPTASPAWSPPSACSAPSRPSSASRPPSPRPSPTTAAPSRASAPCEPSPTPSSASACARGSILAGARALRGCPGPSSQRECLDLHECPGSPSKRERGARLLSTDGKGAAALGPSLTAGSPPPHVLGARASMFYLTFRACPRGQPTVRLRASGGLRPACVPRWRPLSRRADIVCAPLILGRKSSLARSPARPSSCPSIVA
jgi:rsbT co-antagonist protein RsbR